MKVQLSFRVVHKGSKKPKDPHTLNGICHQLVGYLNKKVKEFEFCYPLWNPEEPLDRVALIHDKKEAKGLPSDRLWIFVGMEGVPPKPPKSFLLVKSLDGPLLVEALQTFGTETLKERKDVYYVPTLPFHHDHGDDKKTLWTASSLEDPAHGEALMALLPEVTETVEGVLGDVYQEMAGPTKHLASGMAAMTTVVSHMSQMKEKDGDWGEGCSTEDFKDDAGLGTMVGIASALVLKARGLSERDAKRALKHLITKEGRMDGSRRIQAQGGKALERFSGHRSLWLR